MRNLLLVLTVIAIAGITLVNWPTPSAPSSAVVEVSIADIPWRKTATGWERATWLHQPETPDPSPVVQLHPSIVASLILLVSVGALLAFHGSRPTSPVAPSRHVQRRLERLTVEPTRKIIPAPRTS